MYSSWRQKLLSAAVVLAISAWLINYAVRTIAPYLPLMTGIAVLVAVGLIVRALVHARRYW